MRKIKERIKSAVKSRLDTLSPQQRLHLAIMMFGILVVLFLFSIWQTIRDIADREETTNIVIEHIDRPIIVDGKRDYSQIKEIVNGEGRNEEAGAGARRGLGQLIPGGARQ